MSRASDATALGSAAQIDQDTLFDPRVLAAWHEQTHTSEQSQDDLAPLQRRPEAARVAAHLVDPETVWLAEPSGRWGRSVTFTDAAIQAA